MCQTNWIKIFHRADKDFVFSALQKFENGDKFISIIKATFTKIQSKIKINGLLSHSFTLMQRVCQGCPLWILLQIIATDVLTNFDDKD